MDFNLGVIIILNYLFMQYWAIISIDRIHSAKRQYDYWWIRNTEDHSNKRSMLWVQVVTKQYAYFSKLYTSRRIHP
jgi:hypothetical protein